jgi:hypothetical protein
VVGGWVAGWWVGGWLWFAGSGHVTESSADGSPAESHMFCGGAGYGPDRTLNERDIATIVGGMWHEGSLGDQVCVCACVCVCVVLCCVMLCCVVLCCVVLCCAVLCGVVCVVCSEKVSCRIFLDLPCISFAFLHIGVLSLLQQRSRSVTDFLAFLRPFLLIHGGGGGGGGGGGASGLLLPPRGGGDVHGGVGQQRQVEGGAAADAGGGAARALVRLPRAGAGRLQGGVGVVGASLPRLGTRTDRCRYGRWAMPDATPRAVAMHVPLRYTAAMTQHILYNAMYNAIILLPPIPYI